MSNQILIGGQVSIEQITDEKLQAMNHLFKCQICFQVLDDPIECPTCSSLFCRGCIKTYQKSKRNECVMRCSLRQLTPANRTLRKLLEELVFVCNNQANGCDLKIPYEGLTSHHAECEFAYV